MAKKQPSKRKTDPLDKAYIEGAGIVEQQPITETLEKNYMPYAMSVILSRALPEIDGFKPSHRKILYTMYKMGLLNGRLTKSANIVGTTMKLNPHGDSAIYETMVRLSRGHEALLHPYVESKGNFGRSYSRDMAYAASRYTEAKLANICAEIFKDIDKDTVDFVPNYDNTTTEPTLLPTTFPSILVNSNVGIAVSMASSICPFNLAEVCETAIGVIKHKNFDISQTLKGPDFAGGGLLIYDEEILKKIYETGRGSVKIRSRYNYDKSNNCIDIYEIPPTTTIEGIMDKIVDLMKQNKIREISDMRDETDLNGLNLTLDLKRGVDPELLMRKLFKLTPLEDSYSCNFNILINGNPRVMGVYEILNEWHAFRQDCTKRKIKFDLNKKQDKLHLLQGLKKILLDIDKAIKIIRETEEESEVVFNLMIGFGIDEIQAEYVAEIKLRHLNREYILKRTKETNQLIEDIESLKEILSDDKKIDKIICDELKEVSKKYGQSRKTIFLYPDEIQEYNEEESIPDYAVNLFLTEHGYLKKITPQSLRMSNKQKLKEDDKVVSHLEVSNNTELLFFTNNAQVYKTNLSKFSDSKASIMGDFVPASLEFDENEKVIGMATTTDYSGHMLFFFENGKLAKIPLKSYQTKTNRKKLSNAYASDSPVCGIFQENDPLEYMLEANNKRTLLVHSASINPKTTKNSKGVSVMTLNKGCILENVRLYEEGMLGNVHRFRTKNLPARGAVPKTEDLGDQLSLTIE